MNQIAISPLFANATSPEASTIVECAPKDSRMRTFTNSCGIHPHFSTLPQLTLAGSFCGLLAGRDDGLAWDHHVLKAKDKIQICIQLGIKQ